MQWVLLLYLLAYKNLKLFEETNAASREYVETTASAAHYIELKKPDHFTDSLQLDSRA